METRIDLIEELRWRGLLHQCTDEAGLRQHLADPVNHPRKIYAGFDPTAPSLTIGNLVPIMLLAHVKRAGHIPVVLMGGGTGLIGDPSGKSAERTLMTPETVKTHINAQRPIFDAVLGSSRIKYEKKRQKFHKHKIVNNARWLSKISYIEALRDIGKYFSVNMMMQKESVKARLENREQGISYTEFSYMILQAYDFAHLYEKQGITVQMGGSDQFGNIVAGADLIRRIGASIKGQLFQLYTESEYGELKMHGLDVEADEGYDDKLQRLLLKFEAAGHWVHFDKDFAVQAKSKKRQELLRRAKEKKLQTQDPFKKALSVSIDLLPITARDSWDSFGLTAPLVTKADGGKFGKTETGAVWLTAERTSPYAYSQFWLNASDADAADWIKIFTFLDRPTIEALLERHAANPGARELQRTLAREATAILHGEAAMEQAEAAGKAMFSGDIAGLDRQTLAEVLSDVPSSNRDRVDLGTDGVDLVEVLVETELAKSKREAREFLASGSVSVNGEKVGPDARLTEAHLLHGSMTAIRRGKKNWHLIRWS